MSDWKQNKMLVSVITVVKNDLKRLKKTISSLQKFNNCRDIEHINIDGNSINNTSRCITKLQQKNNTFGIKANAKMNV